VILGQSGHPHISFAFLVPLMLLAVGEILVRQRRPLWLVGPLLGLMAGCQLVTGVELLAATVLFGMLLLLVLLVNNPRAIVEWRRVVHTRCCWHPPGLSAWVPRCCDHPERTRGRRAGRPARDSVRPAPLPS
jgi:hypothetical protein